MTRPRFHYAPRANWLSDPNGLVHHAGEWHMCYQYNPQGEDWGHMAWGHAVSPDLVRWTELPPALVEAGGEMVYSGTAVVDHADSAGFGRAALVAIYTAARAGSQAQALAFSTDHGRTWTRYPGNPVLDEGLVDFRDPAVFWHEPSARWIMAVVRSTENRAALYASTDLRAWQPLSVIDTDGAPGHVWECPLLIELPVEGEGTTRWLFKVDVLQGAPGSGALYRVGHFDGCAFVPETGWQVVDHGCDFYAAIGWQGPRDAAGSPAWIGWMGNHAVQRHLPRQGWRGAMSVPRRLSLRRAGEGWRLVQRVEPALDAAMAAQHGLRLGAVPVACGPGIVQVTAPDFALALDDQAGRQLAIARHDGTIRVTRRDPVTPELDAAASMPAHGPVVLLLDHGSLEVIADHGAAAMTLQHRLEGAAWSLVADRALGVRYAPSA